MKTRVAVIGGGQNCEHEVSLASAAAVAAALDHAGYDVVPLTIGADGTLARRRRPAARSGRRRRILRGCDVVVPVVHGPRGEDGTLAALCELAGCPYVGSGPARRRAGHGQVGHQARRRRLSASPRPRRACSPLRPPPATAGPARSWSSRSRPGRAAASPWSQSQPSCLQPSRPPSRSTTGSWSRTSSSGARSTSPSWAAPTAPLVAPALEIVGDGLFDYDAKYGGQADFRVPAALCDAERTALEDAAVAMFDALGCAGVARVDFFLTEDGPVLNEVNTMPGFTEHSQVPKMFAAAGLPYPDLLDLLVRDTLSRTAVRPGRGAWSAAVSCGNRHNGGR